MRSTCWLALGVVMASAVLLGCPGPDPGEEDGGQTDSGSELPDAGQPDAGSVDSGTPDAGRLDGGASPLDGVWTGRTAGGRTVSFDVEGGMVTRFNFGLTVSSGTRSCTLQDQVVPRAALSDAGAMSFPFRDGGISTTVSGRLTGTDGGGTTTTVTTTTSGCGTAFASSVAWSATNQSALGVPFPDLQISVSHAASAPVPPNAFFLATRVVTNNGGSLATAFTTSLSLSRDAVAGGADDIPFPVTDLVSELAPGTPDSRTMNLVVPSGTPLGSYYLCATVDPGQWTPEANEANNTACATTPLDVNGPDLVVTSISYDGGTVGAPATLPLTYSVLNQGSIAAPATQVSLQLVPAGSTPSGGSGSRYPVGSLAVSQEASGSGSVTVPVSILAGTYSLCAYADDASQASELDETNNARCGAASVVVSKPDLWPSNVTAPANAYPGGPIGWSDVFHNTGGSAVPMVQLSWFLSLDATWSPDDPALSLVGTLYGLNAGVSYSSNNSGSVYSTTPAGTYHICTVLDQSNSVAELDETNNWACSTATVLIAYPDLVPTAVSTAATSVPKGTAFSVTATLRNQGQARSGGYYARFVLTPNAVVGDADDVLLTPALGTLPLDPAASQTLTASVTVPSTTASGTYQLGVIADSTAIIPESDETNNTLPAAGTVTVP